MAKKNDAIEEFKKKWAELPPLVRASAASSAVDAMVQRHTSAVRHQEQCERLGMMRRTRVTEQFASAFRILGELMVVLANESDREAAEKGIDLDVG